VPYCLRLKVLPFISFTGIGDNVLKGIDDKIRSRVHEGEVSEPFLGLVSISLVVGEGMQHKFAEVIPSKLAENGVLVECKICSREDQADYFYDALALIHDKSAS
jgi:hypothetical protein